MIDKRNSGLVPIQRCTQAKYNRDSRLISIPIMLRSVTCDCGTQSRMTQSLGRRRINGRAVGVGGGG